MSSEIAVQVENLSKCYHVYASPQDRLKQFLLPRVNGLLGMRRRRYYDEFWSLREVSFEIGKGEVVGIIGRNGSGKSTLLQLICGTLTATSGRASTHGRIAALLELGSGFNPEFTGKENVYLNAAVLGLSRDEIDRKYAEILEFADIGEFIDRPIKTYSSGMAVRLAFAVASCVDPDILVVDEALAVGDAAFQAKCFRRFLALRERGVTVLLVTHDIGAVVQLCDRALVMHQGRLVASGSPKAMADEYRRRCADEVASMRGMKAVRSRTDGEAQSGGRAWMAKSADTQEYGDGMATIENFTLLDAHGRPSEKLISGEDVTLRMKLRFDAGCERPIVAFGIRDLAGMEIFGTNSRYEKCELGAAPAGSTLVVEYRFPMLLQAGVYNLTMACTELLDHGLCVHHRLYDALAFEVVASREFMGRVDLRPSTSIAWQ